MEKGIDASPEQVPFHGLRISPNFNSVYVSSLPGTYSTLGSRFEIPVQKPVATPETDDVPVLQASTITPK